MPKKGFPGGSVVQNLPVTHETQEKPLEHLLLCLMSMQIHFPGGPVVVFPAEASL